jgi:hypothetical protein
MTLNQHGFVHGLDFYGSFLAIKKDLKLNIIDDLEYLVQSEFFNKHKNSLFSVEDYSHLIATNAIIDEKKQLKPLKISTSAKSALSIKSINEELYENIFEDSQLTQTQQCINLNDVKNLGVELEDITNSDIFDTNNMKRSESYLSKSTNSSCSSRSSHTRESECDEDDEDNEDDNNNVNDNNVNDNNGNDNNGNDNNGNDNNDDDIDQVEQLEDHCDDDSSEGSWESIEEEKLFATFPKFPVQAICMEKCEDTFDSLLINGELEDEEIISALMQIIMTLLVYQKMYSFTHNDLHTNNVMYQPTNKEFIYYVYNKIIYKVPTYGKIYKIIDFGRAIYQFKGNKYASDSFQPNGDAYSQYNTEPFFNENKPRLEPNYSFDLCRLACSLFDIIVEDFDSVKDISKCSPLVQLVNEWCLDDNGINVLYKTNGVERYPDFKLYKMIARHVHKHTPQNQLEKDIFKKFIVSKKKLSKTAKLFDIDALPIYI